MTDPKKLSTHDKQKHWMGLMGRHGAQSVEAEAYRKLACQEDAGFDRDDSLMYWVYEHARITHTQDKASPFATFGLGLCGGFMTGFALVRYLFT